MNTKNILAITILVILCSISVLATDYSIKKEQSTICDTNCKSILTICYNDQITDISNKEPKIVFTTDTTGKLLLQSIDDKGQISPAEIVSKPNECQNFLVTGVKDFDVNASWSLMIDSIDFGTNYWVQDKPIRYAVKKLSSPTKTAYATDSLDLNFNASIERNVATNTKTFFENAGGEIQNIPHTFCNLHSNFFVYNTTVSELVCDGSEIAWWDYSAERNGNPIQKLGSTIWLDVIKEKYVWYRNTSFVGGSVLENYSINNNGIKWGYTTNLRGNVSIILNATKMPNTHDVMKFKGNDALLWKVKNGMYYYGATGNDFSIDPELAGDQNTTLLVHFNNTMNETVHIIANTTAFFDNISYCAGVYNASICNFADNKTRLGYRQEALPQNKTTIQFWHKPNGGTGNFQYLIAQAETDSTSYWYLIYSGSSVYWRITDSYGDSPTLAVPWNPIVGQWYFVSIVLENLSSAASPVTNYSVKIYINDTLTFSSTKNISKNGAWVKNWTIGSIDAYDHAVSGYLNGSIDELRVLNTTRTAAEIAADYYSMGGNITINLTPTNLSATRYNFTCITNTTAESIINITWLVNGTYNTSSIATYGSTGLNATANINITIGNWNVTCIAYNNLNFAATTTYLFNYSTSYIPTITNLVTNSTPNINQSSQINFTYTSNALSNVSWLLLKNGVLFDSGNEQNKNGSLPVIYSYNLTKTNLSARATNFTLIANASNYAGNASNNVSFLVTNFVPVWNFTISNFFMDTDYNLSFNKTAGIVDMDIPPDKVSWSLNDTTQTILDYCDAATNLTICVIKNSSFTITNGTWQIRLSANDGYSTINNSFMINGTLIPKYTSTLFAPNETYEYSNYITQLNVTPTDAIVIDVNAWLYFNGSAQTVTKTGNYSFTANISIGGVTGLMPQNILWIYNVTYNTSTIVYNNYSNTTNVQFINITNCSVTIASLKNSLNVSFFDLTNGTSIEVNTTAVFSSITMPNGVNSKTLGFTATNVTNISICVTNGVNLSYSTIIQYARGGYNAANYNENNYLNNLTRLLSLYLSSQPLTNITINVIDGFNNGLEGLNVRAYLLNLLTGNYSLASGLTTDVNGQVIMGLATGNNYYDFQVWNSSTMVYNSSTFQITNSSYTFYVFGKALTPLDILSNLSRIPNTLTNTSSDFIMTWNDNTTLLTTRACIRYTHIALNNLGIDYANQTCYDTTSFRIGNFSVNWNNTYINGTFIATSSFFLTNGNEYPLKTITFKIGTKPPIHDTEGLLFAIIIIGTLGAIGARHSIPTGIVMAIVGMIATGWLGLFTPSVLAISSMVCIGIIIIILVRQ